MTNLGCAEPGAALGTSWVLKARCRDMSPEIFFPSDGAGVKVARRYCAECQVRPACLQYALDNHIDHGVWGGASERARQRIARGREGAGPTTVVGVRPTAPSSPPEETSRGKGGRAVQLFGPARRAAHPGR